MCSEDTEVREFCEQFLDKYDKANESILSFIGNFRNTVGSQNVYVVENLFLNSYCYYFALMLKDAFPLGEIMWSAPFGHIVFVYDDVPYDVTGVYQGDGIPIPLRELKHTLESFKHRGRDLRLQNEMKQYASKLNISYDELLKNIYKSVPESMHHIIGLEDIELTERQVAELNYYDYIEFLT